MTAQKENVSGQSTRAVPKAREAFAVLGEDGQIDPDLIYATDPDGWAHLHGRPAWRVRIVPLEIAADGD